MRNEEPVFPWDRADFRHHILRLVREFSALTNAATIFGTAGTRSPHGHEKR